MSSSTLMANFCLSPRFLSELAVLGSFFTLPYRSFASCLSTFLIYDMDGSILSWSLTSRNTFWAETICPFFSIILFTESSIDSYSDVLFFCYCSFLLK